MLERTSPGQELRTLRRKLGLALLALFCGVPGSTQLQGQTVYHVSTQGLDTNPGTAAQPFRTPQRGVNAARAGDTILLHAGTYNGVVDINKSGMAGKPITLAAAGDGAVTLTASLPPELCSQISPTLNRTIMIRSGSDYWTIRGLVIVGGITIVGTNLGNLTPRVGDRRLPGRGMYDPAAARTTLESLGSDGADYIQIVNNEIRGRGVRASATRYGLLENNNIHSIDCGTGGGLWLGLFSDGWTIRGNRVHDIADSAGNHWMSEGLRLGTSSMYNTIEKNVVERAWGLGRGLTTDATAGWNVFSENQARYTDIGFSEQKGGWGNHWLKNVADNNRTAGFRVGPGLTTLDPAMPLHMLMKCNKSLNNPLGLAVGSAGSSAFDSNDFRSVSVSMGFRSYWLQAGNTWDGSTSLPSATPSSAKFLENCSATESPAIGLSTTAVSFSGTAGGDNPAPKSFQISNAGGGTLTWTASDNAAWLTASPSSGTNSGTVTLTVSSAGLPAATHSASVTISATGAPSKTVAVTLTLSSAPEPPAIGLSTTSVSFSGTVGGDNPAPESLQISNLGGGTLTWTASEGAAWLAASPTSGTNSGTVSLSVNSAGLPAGTHSANVTVSATGAPSKTVAVTLALSSAPEPPAIGLSTTAVSFSGTAGGDNPAPKSFQISNAGGGTLTWTLSENAAWLSASPTSGSNSGTVSLSVNSAGLPAGTHSASVTVSATGAPSKTVAVTLTLASAALQPPAIGLSTTSVSFQGKAGEGSPAPQSFRISNAGGGTLAWAVSENAAWLSASPTSGSNSGSVTLAVNSAGLGAGTYAAAVTVSANAAASKTIKVTLKLVGGRPRR